MIAEGQGHVIEDTHIADQRRLIEYEANPPAEINICRLSNARRIDAQEPDRAFKGRLQPGGQPHGETLARAVAADKGHQFPMLHQ